MRFLYKSRFVWLIGFILTLAAGLILYFYTSLDMLRNILLLASAFFLGVFLPILTFRKAYQTDESYRKRLETWNDISYRVKKSGEYVFSDSNQGIIVYSVNEKTGIHTINWCNATANMMFLTDTLVDKTLENMMGDSINKIDLTENFELEFYGKVYHCITTKHNVLYLEDITQERDLTHKYYDESLVLGVLNLDNYDQSMIKLTNQMRLQEATAIAQLIEDWGQHYNIAIQNVKDDEYLLIMNVKQLETLAHDDFDIIDTINNHANRQDYFMHVTIGIATDRTLNAADLLKKVDAVLLNAHEKGGNQVGIYRDGKVEFKNALLNAYENTSPTYVRLKAEELFGLINTVSSDRTIYIMSHYGADTDAFGASIAAFKLVDSFHKNVKIVINEEKCGETVKNIFGDIKSNHQNMKYMFIDADKAQGIIRKEDLVMIVDVSKEAMVMNPNFLNIAHAVQTKIAVIDHHRNKQINKSGYDYIYINPAGSSTVEMIVEMIKYAPNTLEISSFEANLLLAGVVVDTNNYMQHMSYRTYEVLSTLQKWGADTTAVQSYLRDNLAETKAKNQAINEATFIKNRYALTQTGAAIINEELLSKIADNLSMIENIEAAFSLGVIGRDGYKQIAIKARSLGYLNVEALMHQLFNGGGHANQAAASIMLEIGDNDSVIQNKINDAEDLIKKTLEELETKEEIWVILTNTYRNGNGTYTKGEKIQVSEKEAAKLIKKGTAVKDTIDNQKMIDDEINQDQLTKLKYQNRINATKKLLNEHVITLYVDLEGNGSLKNRISTKLMTQTINKELKASHEDFVVIEESMIRSIDRIKNIGDYTIMIKLTRDDNIECHVEVKQKLNN